MNKSDADAAQTSDAFEQLLARLRPKLHRYCARITGSVIDGEDVLQEALLKAVAAFDATSLIVNPEGWTFRIAHNAALDFLRRRARHAAIHTEVDSEMIADPVNPAEDRQIAAASLRTFMHLPVGQRSSIILMDVLGYSLEEISGVTGSSIPAIKTALHRGRARLRELARAPDDRPAPSLTERERALLGKYIERFNARDFEAIRDMLADEVRLELVAQKRARGRSEVAGYFHNYNRAQGWQLDAGFVEGRPAILVRNPDDLVNGPSYFVLLEWADGRVVSIRDFAHARYVIDGADIRRSGRRPQKRAAAIKTRRFRDTHHLLYLTRRDRRREERPGMTHVGIGDAVRRKEDDRLIVGGGCYADDLEVGSVAHAIFLRSPHAHAHIKSIDTSHARAAAGVLAILTGVDVARAGLKAIPHAVGSSHMGSDVPLRNRDGSERLATEQLLLPVDRARFAGEAVAMVVAETVAAAKDAADLIDIAWEPLPAVTLAAEAIGKAAPLLWDHVPGNLALDAEIGDGPATDAAFAKAAHRVRLDTRVQRVTGVHLEPRGVVASYDAEAQRYVVHVSHGLGVVQVRTELATILGVAPEQVRVIAPRDVGGNFGTRNATHPDWALVAHAARIIDRPVKHVADRNEAFLSDFQARDLTVVAELALDAKGTILAMRSQNLSNIGAHAASFVPLNKGVQLMTSLYAVPLAHYHACAALTNTPSTIPYRSAGRPEAMFVIERLLDLAARECGFDRVALRRRNLIAAKALPWRNPVGITYDSGDYAHVMRRALDLADWAGFPARRKAARKRSKLAGIGIANYIEATSGVPRERADLTVAPDGRVELVIGTQATGQGHETSFSQIVADWLGVPFDAVTVRAGDTDFVKAGGGSHSGRSIRFGSIVIRAAADAIIQKGREIAALLLQAPVDAVSFAAGRFAVEGTARSLDLFEVAAAATKSSELPENLRGPLAGSADKVTPGLCFPYGTCVCEVDVDPETGEVAIVRYTSVDDVGRAVNPMILHGQTHGGIAQGVGQALMEECWYDRDNGQPLSASLMDYAVPRADDLPSFATDISEIPASSHPLGFRSGGEGGTTPALGVVINAIVDALWHLGVRHIEMPATSAKVWQAIRDARPTAGA